MDKFGIAHIAQIAMRIEPSHRAEMCSQVIFGDPYQVIEENGKWLKIKTLDCAYEGWIDEQLFNSLHPDDVESYLSTDHFLVTDYLMFIREFESNVTFPIYMGSHFPYPNDGMLILGNAIFMIELPEEKSVATHPGVVTRSGKTAQICIGLFKISLPMGRKNTFGHRLQRVSTVGF